MQVVIPQLYVYMQRWTTTPRIAVRGPLLGTRLLQPGSRLGQDAIMRYGLLDEHTRRAAGLGPVRGAAGPTLLFCTPPQLDPRTRTHFAQHPIIGMSVWLILRQNVSSAHRLPSRSVRQADQARPGHLRQLQSVTRLTANEQYSLAANGQFSKTVNRPEGRGTTSPGPRQGTPREGASAEKDRSARRTDGQLAENPNAGGSGRQHRRGHGPRSVQGR